MWERAFGICYWELIGILACDAAMQVITTCSLCKFLCSSNIPIAPQLETEDSCIDEIEEQSKLLKVLDHTSVCWE